jgi:pilus assembly protein CpaB
MSRRVLVVVLAVLLAATGTAGVLLYVRQADARAVAGKETVSVLVAAKKVPAGTSVADARGSGLVRTEIMPKETVPDDTLLSGDDLSGLDAQVAAGDIAAGQLLRRAMFVAKSVRADGLDIPDGKMVVSIAVNSAQEVAGYLKAGSMVTVFDTFTVAENQGRTPAGDDLARNHEYNQATRVLLPKVQVLAVGPAPQSTKSNSSTTSNDPNADVLVTVAVTQAEAEKLVHGAQVGHLYLAMVPEGVVPSQSVGVDNRSVFGVGGPQA